MKSKDFQNLVLSKYQSGDGPTKIFRDLNGSVSLRVIERWCKAVRDTGSIKSTDSSENHSKDQISTRATRTCLITKNSSRTSVRRILRNDLGLRAYKIPNESVLTNEYEEKRVKFVNWTRKNFRKQHTMKILFFDEKMFDIDGIYNSQNDRIWAINRSAVNTKGSIRQKRKFPQTVMV